MLLLNRFFRSILLASLVAVLSISATGILLGADYQWSVSVDGVTVNGVDPGYPRAFLWIPPTCKHVRAIVLSQNNMQEESILEDANFRKTLSDLGFAEIWVTPSLGSIHFRFDQGADQILAKVLKDLSTASGYGELETAPLIPIGHSATASFGWDIAAWNPGRTLAVLSISGQWPYYRDNGMGNNSSPEWGDKTVDGVPGLTTKGEYEIQGDTDGWYFHLKGDSFSKHPKTAFTQIVEPGAGHFNASDEKIALICLYLRKAAQYRLPATDSLDGTVTLTPIDPTQTGWLFDVWHRKDGPASPAAAVQDYQGNRDQASWAFDEEMAKAIEAFQSKFRGKPNVMIGYKQKDGMTLPSNDHAMFHLKFEPQSDGLTFKLATAFWDTIPADSSGKGGEWNNWLGEGTPVNTGDPVAHPQGADGQIVLTRITGPVVQTAPDTFVIHPYRTGNQGEVWFAATFPGDETYKGMVQQAQLQFPKTNQNGDDQTITFPPISDVTAGAPPIKLGATASSNAPVSYYVREGPAEISQDGTLTFTAIPPRAKFPVEITVIATQWGRSVDPKLKTADPVERTFSITGNSASGLH